MESYFRNLITELFGFKNLKNIFTNMNGTLIGILFSTLTSALTVISYELFRKYKNRILQLRRIKSNFFKLQRQMIVLWNKFTKYLRNTFEFTNRHQFVLAVNSIDFMMLLNTYEKNKKIYEKNNLNTYCLLKFKMQLQGKSHLLIKNSGMMIGAFHKLANLILLR
jgi:hypothetical protein